MNALIMAGGDANTDLIAKTHRALSQIWIDFESDLANVPLVNRMLAGRMRQDDYLSLLRNLRQQVIEGSRWIGRAASQLSPDYEGLRSLFLKHTLEEHRDYRMLEENYVAAGGVRGDIQNARKNIGSEALSAYMYQAAATRDPLGMLGAMFIIEGLGNRVAGPWAAKMQEQLGLPDKAFSFFTYHGEHDGEHLEMFDRAIAIAATNEANVEDIIRHAKVVARLYRLQLEEIDNV